MLHPDDSDDDDLATSADRELFNKFRMGERRVSTVYRVVQLHLDFFGPWK